MRGLPTALFLITLFLAGCGGVDTDEVRSSIQQLSRSAEPFAADGEDAFREQVQAYYERRDFEPIWVASRRSRDELRELVQILCRADRDGLFPAEYAGRDLAGLMRQAYEGKDPESMARLDLALTHALLHYTSDLVVGRVDPREIGTEWHTPLNKVDILNVLTDSTSIESLRGMSDRIAQTHEQYGRLRDALQAYRALAARGGWANVPPGEKMSPGDSGARVQALIARLAATGDIDTTAADSVGSYTRRVAEGVRRFQQRHGLEPDGIAGERVLEEMNVPVEDRIRQIALNLERWRWIPTELGNRYIYVNIPAFELHAFDSGREALSMAVVVGEVYEENATPVFSDTMEYVVFNPYWGVPERIAKEEILPKARRDPGYLARNNYEVVSPSGDVVNANLSLVESGQYMIRQKPGRRNSLGQIKFMFPNEFDIYLHDTPAEHLFQRAERAYSHGCIRVEKPIELAEFVFSGSEWTADRVREAIDSGESRTERLKNPLPVYIFYWTAFVDKEGRINFREDLYGNDELLMKALAPHAPEEQSVPCDSLLALIK